MMKITQIKEYDKKRRKIILDDGGCVFLLYTGELRKLRLKEGDELGEEEYYAIEKDILIPRAKKRVLYYLKNGSKTRAEVIRKLKESFYPENAINEAVAFLEGYSFIDDKRYAESFVGSKKGKYSRRELEAKLYQKGVSKEEIKEALEEISDDEELEACIKLLRKRIKSEDALVDPAEKRKNYAYLMRKGYSYDTVEKAFREIKV
ncbi:MAG: regulatory protein RecX [Eubacteriales bacterium]|nr:regulatory protein RecX [Eubacteriales bacterium]